MNDPKSYIIAGIGILLIIILAGLNIFLASARGKGFIGELKVRFILGRNIPGKKYVVNDITITDERGKSCQIDHVLINRNGVYVIETKNYTGRIYGKESDQEWTQVFNFGKSKFKFYNPVKQNATHVYKLKQVAKISMPIHSAVVFVNDNIKYIKAENVYSLWGLRRAIKRRTGENVEPEKMQMLFDQLTALKEENTVTRAQHVKNISRTLDELEHNICPRCGGKLVERAGRYGTFLGCENYPKCKFIKK